jgi:tripartite-type tricarboxylate transporter receptor subunit TctC
LQRFHPTLRYLVVAAVVAITMSRVATAQDAYPSKPIKIIVPYSAGGGVDATARFLGERLRETLKQSVIVDNKPGASGMIGAQAVAKSPPDGSTLLLAAAGEIAVNPHLYKKMDYDPEKDLAPVSLVVKVPNGLVVNPDVQANNVAELVAYAKANPGKLTFSSSGVGNPQHLAGELLNKMAGIEVKHVPYKGAAQQLTDVIAKHVSMTFTSLASALPFIKSGQVKAIAVTSPTRVSSLPDVAALAEFKPLASYELVNWFGVFAPAKTPEPIIKKLNDAVNQALQSPELAKKLEAQGMEPAPSTPQQLGEFAKSESKKYAKIISEANVTLE